MKSFIYVLFSVCTGMVGHAIHGWFFWSVVDFLFPVFAWAKWLICHEVNVSILKNAFSWFLA